MQLLSRGKRQGRLAVLEVSRRVNFSFTNVLPPRYTTGFRCGVHPGMSELDVCVEKEVLAKQGELNKQRRLFFVTMLREPISRLKAEGVGYTVLEELPL